jgi:outer membrane lipopolysaccharide assembly protein LptE/RlpB
LSRARKSVLALALVAATLGGCGYSLRGTLPAHIKTVGVPIFGNRTSEPGVEAFVTRAIVEAFSTNGRLRVVHPADADAVLEGEVIGYDLSSIAFDRESNQRVLRLVLTLNVTFRDVRKHTVLFQQTGFQERSDFRVVGAVTETISREETAVRAAAVDIARAVVTLAVDRF